MNPNTEQKINELISKMTIEEKVGQLQQCGPSLVGAFEVSFEELLDMMFDGRISQEEFGKLMSTATQDFHEEDLRAGRIGSYNGVGDAKTANHLQQIAVEETRLGIPLLFGYDVIHGFKTITPIPLAESCAWEPKLWEKTARMSAKEASAAGVHMTFAPMVDVAKDARWGRVSEGAGEDTLLNACYGAAKVKGFQNDSIEKEDSLIACVKHFAAYGAGEAGKDYNRVDLSLQRLHEEYLPPYKACIDAGAKAIMPAFNDINGVPCSVNPWLLKEVLRKQWGFDGITVSDANAIAECVNHGFATDRKAAAKEALEAGMEIDMTSNVFSENLVELIKSGEVEENVLNQAVSNILRIKFEAGLFDHPYQTDETREEIETSCTEYRELAREAAVKSMVLLKNEQVLPLKSSMKLGIFGDLAKNRGEMTGAWAIGANPEDCVSIVDACNARNIQYTFCAGENEGRIDQEEINRIAYQSDVLLVAVGERKDESGEAASRAEITLPAMQKELIEALLQTKKPVVAILFNGRPLAIPWIAEQVPAILEAWHPGAEAGNAILDLLYGEVNPSGKLTTTFPYATGQCPLYYGHINTGRPGGKSKFTSKYLDTPLEPVFSFGHGLGYTTFEYKNLKVSKEENALRVLVTIQNTGDREGEEIIQCYIRDVAAKRVRPVKQLMAFAKEKISEGEERIVEFLLPYESMGYYDMAMNTVVEPGEFILYIGGNSRDCISQSFVLE